MTFEDSKGDTSNLASSIQFQEPKADDERSVNGRKKNDGWGGCELSAPRGYHLFQNGPIKLLSGALEAEIPRIPGSRNSRTRLVTPEYTPKAEGNSRISMAPSSLLASRVTDYRKWVLAVQAPPGEEEEPFDEAFQSAAALLRAETPEDPYAKVHSNGNGTPLEDLITLEDLQKIMKAFATVTVDFFSCAPSDEYGEGSRMTISESTYTKAEEGGTRFPGAPEQKYDRKLTTDEFVEAVQLVVPAASREAVLELVNKVDYEGVGAITWNELSTFLVSQTSHRTFLSQAGAEFTHIPEPLNCFMDNMHQLVSCYCVDESRKLIITGGQEGTVRAWTMTTLSFRGVLFSTDSWITGVHFSSTGRLLYITTMDREIFLMDGSSFEVLRVYRGRPVEVKTNSLVYAHDTTRLVNIGGIALPTRKALERQLADAAKFNEKRQQELASGLETITSASACEALNFDSMPLTGQGNGPYVERLMEECVLAGLVDPVTCSTYNHSHLDEEVILLGTRLGEIYFYIIHSRSNKKVLLSNHTLRVHTERVNKMSFLYSMNALISCADDGKVVVTSMVNGQPIRTFQSAQNGHVAVRDFSIHPYFKMMVTTGPERYGLVWEFSQESPVAVLEAHNSPCRCCTFSIKNAQVVTVGMDGSIFVFDINGFHLSQKIEPVFAYSPLLISYATTGSLLVFRRYPYHLRIKRHKKSSCPEKYRGHTAAMVNILYTKTFDQIVTVDMEFTAMTWAKQTGANVFTFVLNGYSDSATLNSSPLTCASLDVAQRRLITGYQNGVVVVWNVVNGQAINFITAGMEETVDSTLPSRPPTGGINPEQRSPKSRKKRTVGNSLNPGAHRPVRTVGSLVRHGSTFFLFSIFEILYIVRESSDYTVATASSWKVPSSYGEVTCMIQVTPQVMACGTSLGALFFFHVLSEKQDGAVRWLPDPTAALTGIVSDLNFTSDNRLTMKRQTISSMSLAAQQLIPNSSSPSSKAGKQGHHLSRVTQMFQLPAVSRNAFMTVHADGTIAFWHTFRRVFLGSLNLIAAGVDEGKDRSGNIVVAVDDANRLIVLGDEGGNIHVCQFHMEMLQSDDEEAAALALGNPMMYFPMAKDERRTSSASPSVAAQRSPLPFEELSTSLEDVTQVGGAVTESGPSNEAAEPSGTPLKPEGQKENTLPQIVKTSTSKYFQERAIHIMDKFERVNVFGTNIRSISSLIIANSTVKSNKKSNGLQKEDAETIEEKDDPIIICTGADSYSRCFTILGEPIGELGMDPWVTGEKNSYRYMGELTSGELLPTSFTLEKGWYYDYLAEFLLNIRQPSLNVTRKSRARSHYSGSNTNLMEIGSKMLGSKSPGIKETNESATTRDSTAQALRNFSVSDIQTAYVVATTKVEPEAENNSNENRAKASPTREFFPDIPPGFRHHSGKNIDTVIRRSLRQRLLVDVEPFKGVVKRRCLRDIRPPNQVATDDFREPSPPPAGMTPAEAQFLGIIENVFIDSNKRTSTAPIVDQQPLAGSLIAAGATAVENSIVGVLSEEAMASYAQPASSVARHHAVAISSQQSQRMQSTVSLSLPLDDTTEQTKTIRIGFMPQEAFEPPKPPTIYGDTPEKVRMFRTNSLALENSNVASKPPSMYRHNSLNREDTTSFEGSELGNTDLPKSSSFRLGPRNKPATKLPSTSRLTRLGARSQKRPKYVTGLDQYVKNDRNGSLSVDEEFTDPKELIRHHLVERRQHILESGCTENSKRIIEHEMSTCGAGKEKKEDTLDGLAVMGPVVDNVVEHHKKEKGSSALSGALSFIADISSRMYVPPVQEIEAPVGSKSRDEVQAWRDHLSRLQKSTEAKPRGMH